jgi:uncharacterized protein (TIGR01777 family)
MSSPETYVASSSLPVSVADAFAYHERPGALLRLIPPWESVEIEHSDRNIRVGSRVIMKTSIAGLPVRWVAEHTQYEPPRRFADTQVSGPFQAWDHVHEFVEAGQYSLLRDSIRYRLPLGGLGRLLGSGMALRRLEAMFAYRHRITRDDMTLQADHPVSPMSIAISGSSGLVGRSLGSMLTLLGHRVRPLVRSAASDDDAIAAWSSDEEARKLSEVDAVVHLAGKPIAGGRWTESVKEEIRSSRVQLTRSLCESLARLEKKPKVLVCASATGIYGNRGDEPLDETSQLGNTFLADVAGDWERACRPAEEAGIRVVNARFGIVLSPRDGALAKMLFPAKFGGGALGSGGQWWSWIALDDVLGAIYHSIATESLAGPVNFVAPDACTNQQFARTLAATLGRPALFPAPAAALRIALGEMADTLLLASARVTPSKLLSSHYRFRFTDLGESLRYLLGRERLESSE